MTISKIPHQQILKHLGIETSSPKLCLTMEQLVHEKLFQMGALEALSAPILDRIITFLDAATAYQLKITCVAFRSLVEANLHQSARHMPRFFSLASYQILKQRKSKDSILQAIAVECAKRGNHAEALQNAKNLSPENLLLKDWIYREIAHEEALHGNFNAATTILHKSCCMHNQLDAYVIIASSLARTGYDTHAWELADRTPLFDLGAKRRAYEAIALAQVRRGQWELALTTIAKMPQASQEYELNLINEEREKQVRLANALKNPEQIQDPTEKDSVYFALSISLAKEGNYQDAFASALSIQKKDSIRAVYKEIASAQITHGDLQAAFQTVNKIVGWDFLKYEIYALIAQTYAKKGDFIRCLHTLNLIVNDAIRAGAYQKVVTALS